MPVVVGRTLDKIDACYVSVNDILYQVPTVLKAVDATFKIIHSLNATYGIESEQVWTLLQRGVYELTTDCDKRFVAVEGILNELKQIEVVSE